MARPVMQSVHSTHVDRIGYAADTGELYVQWQGGKTSVYSGVPSGVAHDVTNAWSVGQAVREQIIPNYQHRYDGGGA